MILPQSALSDVLTYEIWPSSDPASIVSCRIELKSGQINVVEAKGTGMPPRHGLRWPVRKVEELAMIAALQSLVSGELPSVDTYTARLPPAPLVTVSWSTRVNDALTTGLFVQDGLTLPVLLSNLIETVMPGSLCDRFSD